MRTSLIDKTYEYNFRYHEIFFFANLIMSGYFLSNQYNPLSFINWHSLNHARHIKMEGNLNASFRTIIHSQPEKPIKMCAKVLKHTLFFILNGGPGTGQHCPAFNIKSSFQFLSMSSVTHEPNLKITHFPQPNTDLPLIGKQTSNQPTKEKLTLSSRLTPSYSGHKTSLDGRHGANRSTLLTSEEKQSVFL